VTQMIFATYCLLNAALSSLLLLGGVLTVVKDGLKVSDIKWLVVVGCYVAASLYFLLNQPFATT
jgi:hypothetical protein